MAAECCVMWCMRYNPSQAMSLLLDPLISDDSAKFQTDFGGFVHLGFGKSPDLLLSVFLDTPNPCSSIPGVRISPGSICHPDASPQSAQIHNLS